MTHHEILTRMNAELNTPESWARRWQIEREHNEHLASQGSMVRTGVHDLHRRAIERFTNHQAWAREARHADDPRRAEVYERICTTESGRVRALDDVLELMDAISRHP
jgi:hypothetical protein